MRALKSLFAAGFVAVVVAGCGGGSSPLPSTAYTTNAIYAYMKAVQDESGNVDTTVQLRDGTASTSRYLYLAGDETLYSTLDVPPRNYMSISGNLFSGALVVSQRLKVMSPRDLFIDFSLFSNVVQGNPEYVSADTPSAGSALTRAYVDFERSGQVMTAESSVELPPAFQISAPVAEAVVSRANPLTLTWTNPDATSTMKLDVSGICADGSRYSQNSIIGTDTGSATLSSASYFPAIGTSLSTNCRVAFVLQRVRIGGVSPKFAFGSLEGIQKRTVQFTITP